jgi:hypothetical protein
MPIGRHGGKVHSKEEGTHDAITGKSGTIMKNVIEKRQILYGCQEVLQKKIRL